MRIGYEDADRLISYPDPHNLSIWRQPIRMRSRRRHRWTILEGNALGRAWLRCPWRRRGPAGLRANTPNHASAPQAPPVWRAPEGPEGLAGLRDGASPPSTAGAAGVEGAGGTGGSKRGLAAVPVGGGGAWPGFETTRRAQLAARTARGRAAAHGRTKQPGPTAGSDGARNTSGATSTTERRSLRTPRSTPGSGRPGGRRGARAR